MEPSLKNVASTAEERLWESRFVEKLKEDVLYYRDCARESLSKLPENVRNQAEKWLAYLLGMDPETVEGKMKRNDHLSALIEGITLRKLMGIHADSEPPKPTDPIPPVPKTFLDEIEEELTDTTAFEEDCSDAWGQELAGGGGGGDAEIARGRGPQFGGPQMEKTPKDERAYLGDQNPPERPGASFNLHSMPTAKRDGWNDEHGEHLPGRGHFVGPQMAKTPKDERAYLAAQSPPDRPGASFNLHSMPTAKRDGWNDEHGENLPGRGHFVGPQMAKTPKDERAYLAAQSPPDRPGASFNLHSMPTAKRDGRNEEHGENLPGRGHFVGPQMARTLQDGRNYRATQSPAEHPRASFNFHSMAGDKKREGWNVRHGGNIPERRRFVGPQMAKVPNGDRTYLASQSPPEHSAASFNLHSIPAYKKREGWNVRHGENIPGKRRFVGPQLAKPPQDERTYIASYARPEYTGIFNVPAMPANKNVKDWNERTDNSNACSHTADDIMNSLQCRGSEEFSHRQWRLASDAAANRVAADLHARRRTPGVRETSEGTYDYLLDLVDCSLRDEAIEVIEFLLDDLYEDIRKDPENDRLWDFPEAVIREELLLRLLDIISHAKMERSRGERYPWGMPTSQEHFGQEPPSCKCPCHTNIQMPPTLSNMSYMDIGNTWAGGDCKQKSHMDLGKRYKSNGMDGDQYRSRIRSQEKMVARGTQPRERLEPETANTAGDARGHSAFAHVLKPLENKWESLGQSYRGEMKTFTTSKTRAKNMRIPCHEELDGLANETRMKQMHHSEMNKYYGKERPQPREYHHSFLPVRQYY